MANLHQWTAPTTAAEFKAIQDQDTTLFVGYFGDNSNGTMGFVFTSPCLVNELAQAIYKQGASLTAMFDGTYKVSSCRCVLANLGLLSFYYNSTKHKYCKTFMSIGLCYMCSKNTCAYYEFCSIISERLFIYKQVNFVPRFAVMDHSQSIASGTGIAWPNVHILTCWLHLTRNMRKNSNKLINNNKQ